MNSGIPVLSSNLPENDSFIDEGKNGYLCNGPEDFEHRLSELFFKSDDEYAALSEQAVLDSKDFDVSRYVKIMLKSLSPQRMEIDPLKEEFLSESAIQD